ncbi:hypothetical protein AAEU32_11995 [Pseudoalteromonas sp. SSDWG2]|uniref:hypothetical protein n=1 Tax=Pseudoalteromonas sp. SSDWG2 TaxID=3139391 RepID=UPI003BA8471E
MSKAMVSNFRQCFLPLVLGLCAGCSPEPKENNRTTTTSSDPQVSIAQGAALLHDGKTLSGQTVAQGYGMTYSDTAMDEIIPALPIFGFANGQGFNGVTTVFREDHEGNWHLSVSDQVYNPAHGPASAASGSQSVQTVHIQLPNEPHIDARFGKEMAYGGGYFQIKNDVNADTTTSWNTSFSYKLEIDKWQKQESRVGSCGNPALGKASGKIFASFKGSEIEGRVRNSWISGQFTDAAIVYCPKQ